MNKGVNRTLPPAVKPRKNASPPIPVSKPGFEIIVPLALLPQYLQVNGLEPKAWDDTRQRLIVKKTGVK
jgi:hypothetical protein